MRDEPENKVDDQNKINATIVVYSEKYPGVAGG